MYKVLFFGLSMNLCMFGVTKSGRVFRQIILVQASDRNGRKHNEGNLLSAKSRM